MELSVNKNNSTPFIYPYVEIVSMVYIKFLNSHRFEDSLFKSDTQVPNLYLAPSAVSHDDPNHDYEASTKNI